MEPAELDDRELGYIVGRAGGSLLGPPCLHLESSWLHLGSPKPPQISFGSPEVPRAKNWLHLASVWTASWLHGDRFLRTYSIT